MDFGIYKEGDDKFHEIKDYEEEILTRMYDKGYTGMNYKSIEKVRSTIKWQDIANNHNVTKSFNSVMRSLANKGLVDGHGKSGSTYSLSVMGVKHVKALSY